MVVGTRGNGAIVQEEKRIPSRGPWPVGDVVFPSDVESTHAIASASPRELCSRQSPRVNYRVVKRGSRCAKDWPTRATFYFYPGRMWILPQSPRPDEEKPAEIAGALRQQDQTSRVQTRQLFGLLQLAGPLPRLRRIFRDDL